MLACAMARTPRPAQERLAHRWIARTGAVVAVVGVLSIWRCRPSPSLAPQTAPALASGARGRRGGSPGQALGARCASRSPMPASTCRSSRASRNVPGNTGGYPLCDVAQYWTRYDLPGSPGYDLDLRARPAGHVPAAVHHLRGHRRQGPDGQDRRGPDSRMDGCCATASTRSRSALPARASPGGTRPVSIG